MSDSILSNRDGLIVEKGTWTPVVDKVLTTQTLPTYTTTLSEGIYYRIGKLCYVSCCLHINVTSAGDASICISGLPYLSEDSITGRYQQLSTNCLNSTTNFRYGIARLPDNSSKVVIIKHSAEDNQSYEIGNLILSFSGAYIINSSYGG